MATSQELINRMRDKGWSLREIGRAVGRDASYISQIARGKKPGRTLTDTLAKLATRPAPKDVGGKIPYVEPPKRRTTKTGELARVRQPKALRGVKLPKAERLTESQRAYRELTSKEQIYEATRRASERGTGARVMIQFTDANGNRHTLGRKGGIRPSVVRDFLRSHKTLGGALRALARAVYGSREIDFHGVTDIVVIVNDRGWSI